MGGDGGSFERMREMKERLWIWSRFGQYFTKKTVFRNRELLLGPIRFSYAIFITMNTKTKMLNSIEEVVNVFIPCKFIAWSFIEIHTNEFKHSKNWPIECISRVPLLFWIFCSFFFWLFVVLGIGLGNETHIPKAYPNRIVLSFFYIFSNWFNTPFDLIFLYVLIFSWAEAGRAVCLSQYFMDLWQHLKFFSLLW